MSQRFCTNCGNELSKGDKFCAACGTKVPQPQKKKATAAPEPLVPTAVSAVPVPLNTPAPNPQPTEENILSKAFKAFVEMWIFIVMTVKADSAEEKREFRREARKRMFRAPFLTLACPVTALALFVLSLVLANKTGNTFFIYTTIAFAMISFFLVFFFLCIFFTKLKEGDEAVAPAAPLRQSHVDAPQNHGGSIVLFIRIAIWLVCLALIILMLIPSIRYISRKVDSISSTTRERLSSGSTNFKTRYETPVVDTSNAVDINYQDHSSLSPGTICKISNYRVLTTMSDGVIAMFDHAQDYKAKTAARAFVGDGLVTLAEMGENSSKPNIAIITNRNLCDDDAIPTIYARYEGVVDIALGRLRCFREVNPRR